MKHPSYLITTINRLISSFMASIKHKYIGRMKLWFCKSPQIDFVRKKTTNHQENWVSRCKNTWGQNTSSVFFCTLEQLFFSHSQYNSLANTAHTNTHTVFICFRNETVSWCCYSSLRPTCSHVCSVPFDVAQIFIDVVLVSIVLLFVSANRCSLSNAGLEADFDYRLLSSWIVPEEETINIVIVQMHFYRPFQWIQSHSNESTNTTNWFYTFI